ncbi:MAG: hypothetical protein RQ867_04430 [Mariprofundaceae bacterium]|nr:hypothetical protein [Mariprofundaceae bacterium]
MKNEQGFSTIKLLFWGAVIGFGVMAGYKIIPVYNAQWKAQDAFEAIARNMADKDEIRIRKRLPDLFKMKYLARGDLPQEFYDNIVIRADGGQVEISSEYHVTVWLLGPVEDPDIDPDSDYSEADLKGMDKIRHKLRQDYHFKPYAKTP